MKKMVSVILENTEVFICTGSEKIQLPLHWLRDCCTCSICIDADSKQRRAHSFLINPLEVTSAQLNQDEQELLIEWSDAHTSTYPLEEVDTLLRSTVPAAYATWKKDIQDSKDFTHLSAQSFLSNEIELKKALTALQKYGFFFVDGVEVSLEGTEAIARRLGYIRETIFGGLWDFTSNQEHKDSAYTANEIEPHTDGTYSFDAPGYQMFHCLTFEGSGGESILVDGFAIAEEMHRDHPEYFDILCRVNTPGHYIDDSRGVHLIYSAPILRCNSDGSLRQIRFNMLDRAPMPYLTPKDSTLYFNALRYLYGLANNAEFQIVKRLEPGIMLIFDNWRALHGRKSFEGTRHLAGAYLNKEAIESKIRSFGL